MNHSDYSKLWDDNFKDIFKGSSTPSYSEHLQRERMVEDYLDIFREKNTRTESSTAIPYPHPYFNHDGTPKFKKGLKIKYVLVGEAPPPLDIIKSKVGCIIPGGDLNNTYFYDIRHLKRTNYLSSPALNWSCPDYNPCPENKIQCLLSLAEKGVFLIDLFPFPLPFRSFKNPTSLRTKLNISGVTRLFWDDISNVYNLNSRFNYISLLLDKDWDLSLVAPCKISEFIVNPINLFSIIATIPSGVHPLNFRLLLPHPTRCSKLDWKKIAITSGGTPSQLLINLSF